MCVSYLSFVDDIIIFVNGCRSSLHRLMDFLHHYETVFGQLINQPKSNFYVRGNTLISRKTIVQSITGFQPRQFSFTYLGCPVYVRGVQIRHFDDMIRKIRWPSVRFPVAEGGLGVRSFSNLDDAFEMKLWWRFRDQHSLWATFMKSKYSRTEHPSMVQFRYPSSLMWRRLCSICCIARPHIHWLIRYGDNISFWYDCWLDSIHLFHFNPSATSMAPISSFWCDIFCWALSRDVNFSLRSSWEFIRGSRNQNEARNTLKYDSVAFNVDVFIYRVLLDIKLVSDAFGFKPSQLRGILDTQIGEGLQIIMPPRRPPRLVSWMKPPPGVVKLSVDGCSRGNPGMTTTGGVLRDHQGVVLAAFGSFLGHQSILFAELMALLEGLDLAAQLGFSNLEVESDSATVSWAISNRFVRWDFAYLLGRV
ncbi:hypothetical protein KPL71_013964 [Citrus sinensis]|uniref:Uncharacterized protein n=1 Tax=Citrus sinensis TaxID=2711 RepID=A0ACB8K8E8_CITSI|nr:hypothetical protein KPL71_013964 [Citrus sinensis]